MIIICFTVLLVDQFIVHVFSDLMSSQETVILDEDEEEDRPVVNLDSIHRIVSSSQSFIEVKTKLEEGEYMNIIGC